MSLHDASELDDLSPLANESDAVLYSLQKKANDCLKSWNGLGRALDTVEMAFYNRISRIADFVTTTLNVRYGCND